jgi:phosphatidylserine/phosphatidylglycerophosphate/cardiolipin synthase-like enzyme
VIPPSVIAKLAEARGRCSTELWGQLIYRISRFQAHPTSDSITRSTEGLNNPDLAWSLSQAFSQVQGAGWSEIAGAMAVIDQLVGGKKPFIEFIWSGPPNGRFPVRRIDQVLYDLIAGAQRRILVVTFAAHGIAHLCHHLAAAVRRGAALTLIVEREDDSEGQLSIDALHAFRALPLEKTTILYWPIQRRERNNAGRPGKLHAKCAIIDDTAVVSSANFTDDAFNRNMELGILLKEPALVELLCSHFVELHRRAIFRRFDLSNADWES